MIDDFAKENLHGSLRWARKVAVLKLDGLSEYDVRRPLSVTGTNLLGLVKHLAHGEARYFGEVFDRPFPEPMARWDDPAAADTLWVPEHETRAEILGLHQRAGEHADATIDALALDAPGHVLWWPEPEVKLFRVMSHVLYEYNRHLGHLDILREQLDGATGSDFDGGALSGKDAAFWAERCAKIERAAKIASS